MEVLKIAKAKADIQFTADELLTLHNALNEVCNGINLAEFSTRMGVSREEVRVFLKSVGKLIKEIDALDTEPIDKKV